MSFKMGKSDDNGMAAAAAAAGASAAHNNNSTAAADRNSNIPNRYNDSSSNDGRERERTGGGSIENPADCTMIMTDEVGETFNHGADAEEFNFAAALGLRKNLAASFDKHVRGSGDGGSNGNDGKGKEKPRGNDGKPEFSPKTGGVRSRIMELESAARLEQKRATTPSRAEAAAASANASASASASDADAGGPCPKPARFGKRGSGSAAAAATAAAAAAASALAAATGRSNTSNSGRPLSRPRPPMGRSRSKNAGSAGSSSNSSSGGKEGSLLSVYLRIRPIPNNAAAAAATDDHDSTIEIMPATNANAKKSSNGTSAGTSNVSTTTTTIRTYPPENSNAAKVVRTHPSSDMIFGSNGHQDHDGINNTGNRVGVKEYKFNSVLGPTSTQGDVYDGIAKPLVNGLFPSDKDCSKGKLVGQSALLFAYGITNAGKTYTIMGSNGDSKSKSKQHGASSVPHRGLHSDLGVIPRALHDILHRVNELGEDRYQVSLSYFEIYNEQCFDLIESSPDSSSSTTSSAAAYGRSKPNNSVYGPVPLKLRESRDGKIFVKGLNRRKVESLEHGLELIRRAMKKRHTSSNNINTDSSRSHSICQLDIIARPPNSATVSAESVDDDVSIASGASAASGYNTEDEAASLRKKEDRSVSMWIVDLAGSERTKRTGTANKSSRQKEAALINSSLMKLMRCLHTLRDNQKPGTGSSNAMVPFRESKLTHLFMNHLTGAAASRTSMIVNVNPSASDYDETQHVLSYATIAKSIVISEDEQDRKRRAGAMNAMAHTHDDNGRSLSRSKAGRVKSPPKKIARLASKLSPRSMLAKRREQQADAQMRKAQLQSMRGVAPSASSSSIGEQGRSGSGNSRAGDEGPKRKMAKIANGSRSNQQLLEKDCVIAKNVEEISRLRAALAASQVETKAAETEMDCLKEQLAQREAQIRVEVAEEMENQIKSMRDHYQNIIDRLKRQAGQTPGKSARKVRLDRAEAVIEELMDQVEECEEDMARTREVHEEQIGDLTRIHEDALAAKQKEVASLTSYHEEALKMKEREIVELRAKVEDLVVENDEVKRSRDEMITEYEELLREERMIREETARVEDAPSAFEENKSPRATSSVRRLRRERTSEVACSNAPPSPPRSASSAKKKGLFRSKIASGEKKRQQQQQHQKKKKNQSQRQPLSPVPKTRRNTQESCSSEYEEDVIDSSYRQSESESEYSDYE
mmetsp:Transcript_3833/g.8639  ORF Transcript_3833/g.8639 Transcript_3833/m.8639 type:complete len:1208 (-) Transcript_3833:60-3683(-)